MKEIPESELTPFEYTLYQVIDDIDTIGDIAHGNHTNFYNMVMKRLYRFYNLKIVNSNGYKVFKIHKKTWEINLPEFISKTRKLAIYNSNEKAINLQFKLGLVSGIIIGALLTLALMNTLILFMPFNVLLKLLSMIIA